MSIVGQKRKWGRYHGMSAIPLKADIAYLQGHTERPPRGGPSQRMGRTDACPSLKAKELDHGISRKYNRQCDQAPALEQRQADRGQSRRCAPNMSGLFGPSSRLRVGFATLPCLIWR